MDISRISPRLRVRNDSTWRISQQPWAPGSRCRGCGRYWAGSVTQGAKIGSVRFHGPVCGDCAALGARLAHG